jgi:hypothetical protein
MNNEREMDYSLAADGTVGPYVHHSGPLVVQCAGSFGGGEVAVKMDLGNGATTEYTLTTDEPSRIFDFPPQAVITFELSGATAPSLTIACR